MKKKICFLRIILLIMFAGMVTLADDIKIPSCHTEDSLLYLANRLGLNIIYTNFTNCNSKRFYSEAKDIENIISEYQSQNSEILKLEYLKEKNTIICYNNDSEIFLKKLLLSNIIIESGEKIIALLDDQLQIKLNVIFHEKYFPQKGNLAFKYFKDHSSSSVYEILSAFFGDGGQYSVKIERFPIYEKRTEDTIKLLEETLRREDTPSEAHQAINEMLNDIRGASNNKKEDKQSCSILISRNRFANNPSYYDLSLYLQKAENESYQHKSEDKQIIDFSDFCFWMKMYLSFESIPFLEYLFTKDVFNKSSPFSRKIFLEQVPFFLLEEENYGAIEVILKNLYKIESKEMKKNILENLVDINKTRLTEKSRKILLDFARQYEIKRLYLDTSKWVGDDLPEDYDRWQNFKVSETELVFECDKTIATTKYHLKFFKYKEPVKIGGIPLKKMEEADYSTPEKAYFSYLSARVLDWAKKSIYDENNFINEDFDLYACWRNWHSGFDPFILILYKVEISQIGNKKKDSPDLFLFIKVLSDANRIAAIPMKLDGKKWKFYLCWPRDAEILSDYIEEEISKTISKIEDGK